MLDAIAADRGEYYETPYKASFVNWRNKHTIQRSGRNGGGLSPEVQYGLKNMLCSKRSRTVRKYLTKSRS